MLVFSYLWVGQAGVVGFEVVDDSLGRSRQRSAAHQQHKQHDIRERGRDVHHLECTQRAGDVVEVARRQRKQEGCVCEIMRGELESCGLVDRWR